MNQNAFFFYCGEQPDSFTPAHCGFPTQVLGGNAGIESLTFRLQVLFKKRSPLQEAFLPYKSNK